MWNSFIYKDDAYIIKVVDTILPESTKYKIILSNMTHVWIEELTLDQIIERCKTLNPLIDTTDETYINIVLSLLKDISSESELTLSKNDDIVKLECVTNSEGAMVKFNFNLKLSDVSTFCKEITIPMIQTIQLLEKQQKMLCDLLEKKDVEIEQHVFENGGLKRSNVVTEKFEKSTLGSSDKLCYKVFSKSDEFQKIIIAKYGCLDAALLKVKKEEKTSKKKKLSLAKSIIRHKKPKVSTNVKLK